jgi:methyl-accepting chemotaxis protein
MLVLAVLPLLLLGYLDNSRTRQALLADTQQAMLSTAQATARAIDRVNAERMQQAKLLASTDLTIASITDPNADREAVKRLIGVYLASNPSFTGVAILDKDARTVESTDAGMYGKVYDFRPYFQRAIKGELYASEISVSVDTLKPMIVYSAPVKQGNQIVGIVLIRSTGEEVLRLVDDDTSALGDGSSGLLVDRNGIRLYDGSDKAMQFKAVVRPPEDVVQTILKEKQFGDGGTLQATDEQELAAGIKGSAQRPVFAAHEGGTAKQIAAVRLQTQTWTYLVRVPEQTFLAEVTAMGRDAILIMLATATIVAVLAIVIASSIARPIRTIAQDAQRIADGDLSTAGPDEADAADQTSANEVRRLRSAFASVRAYLTDLATVASDVAAGDLTHEARPRSERDTLGIAFQQMRGSLYESVSRVATVANDLASTATGLNQVATEGSAAVEEVAAAVQELAHGVRAQSDTTSQTSTAVSELLNAVEQVALGSQEQARSIGDASATTQEMADDIARVADRAQGVATTSMQARESAEHGARAVRQAVNGMAQIQAVVATAADKIGELGALGEQIGAVVETIDDIAEQTNLLALNAAIEAARAGEHGRGFAVVADEVRKLAERSQRETRAIADLIRDVQAGTRDAVSAMEQGSREVTVGTAQADEAGQALAEILLAVDATASQVEEIAAAAQGMVTRGNHVSDTMATISAAVEQAAAATEQMSASAESVGRSVENIAAVARTSSETTEQLSAAAEQMAAEVAGISERADQLASTADQLRDLVARFQLDATDHPARPAATVTWSDDASARSGLRAAS